MKRDWDLIRDILSQIEKLSPTEKENFSVGISRDEKDDDKQRMIAHVFLLKDAGFITGINSSTFSGQTLLQPDLTWEGHELLATIRSKPVWDKVKSTAQDKGIELSFEAVIQLGKAALALMIGQMT